MKRIALVSMIAAVAALLAVATTGATSDNSFAAGAAQISAPCHFEFDARANGGNVNEQCNFASGRQHFAGPVVCFAASGNFATFVWQMKISPTEEKQNWYQQVFIVDNGAPGHGVPDEFSNYPETPDSPCSTLTLDNPGTSPVLKGNFVVSADE